MVEATASWGQQQLMKEAPELWADEVNENAGAFGLGAAMRNRLLVVIVDRSWEHVSHEA